MPSDHEKKRLSGEKVSNYGTNATPFLSDQELAPLTEAQHLTSELEQLAQQNITLTLPEAKLHVLKNETAALLRLYLKENKTHLSQDNFNQLCDIIVTHRLNEKDYNAFTQKYQELSAQGKQMFWSLLIKNHYSKLLQNTSALDAQKNNGVLLALCEVENLSDEKLKFLHDCYDFHKNTNTLLNIFFQAKHGLRVVVDAIKQADPVPTSISSNEFQKILLHALETTSSKLSYASILYEALAEKNNTVLLSILRNQTLCDHRIQESIAKLSSLSDAVAEELMRVAKKPSTLFTAYYANAHLSPSTKENLLRNEAWMQMPLLIPPLISEASKALVAAQSSANNATLVIQAKIAGAVLAALQLPETQNPIFLAKFLQDAIDTPESNSIPLHRFLSQKLSDIKGTSFAALCLLVADTLKQNGASDSEHTRIATFKPTDKEHAITELAQTLEELSSSPKDFIPALYALAKSRGENSMPTLKPIS